jgi:hypothetical protein
LEVERQYVVTWLLSPVGSGKESFSQEEEQFQTIPNLACLKLPQRDNISKILFQASPQDLHHKDKHTSQMRTMFVFLFLIFIRMLLYILLKSYINFKISEV